MTLDIMFVLLGGRQILSEFHNAVFGQLRASTSLFYLTHIVLIHLLAVLLASIRFGHAECSTEDPVYLV